MIDYQYAGTATDGKPCQGSIRALSAEAARLRLIRGEWTVFQGKGAGTEHSGSADGTCKKPFHHLLLGTSNCGRKPGPATGTSSPAKGWGGSSQPVRLPSGAFWLLT